MSEHLPVPRADLAFLALEPRVAEVVGLVDDHHIGHLLDPIEPVREIIAPQQVGVIEDGQVAEVPGQVAEVASEVALPHGMPAAFGTINTTRLRSYITSRSMSISPTNVLPKPTPSHRKAPPYCAAIFNSA